MVEEVLTPGRQIVDDPEVLEQSFRGELDDGCTQNVPGGDCHSDYQVLLIKPLQLYV
jgi:hypothetical protein